MRTEPQGLRIGRRGVRDALLARGVAWAKDTRPVKVLDMERAKGFLWGAGLIVFALGVLHGLLVIFAGMDPLDDRIRLFNLDGEQTVFSFLSSAVMLVAALACFGVSVPRRAVAPREVLYWRALSCIMAYMALDETISLHEAASSAVRRADLAPAALELGPWVVIAVPVVIAVALFFVRFLRMIDRGTALRFILAGGVFVLGSVGVEVFTSLFLFEQGSPGFYRVSTMFEEGGEILGITIFATTVLSRLRVSLEATPRLEWSERTGPAGPAPVAPLPARPDGDGR
jgi:hypothetical protein